MWWKNLVSGNTIKDVTNIIDEVVVDKDKRNELYAKISMVLMQSGVAKYVRAIIGLLTVISIFFFSDKLVISQETQTHLLYTVYAFYFLDYFLSNRSNKGGARKK